MTTGLFLNDSVPGCKAFILCTNFTRRNLFCPEGFIFNPFKNFCSNSTDFVCYDKHLNFNCTNTGYFENTQDVNCTSFIGCIITMENILFPKLFHCTENKIFSPYHGHCVNKNVYIEACARYEIINEDISLKVTLNASTLCTTTLAVFCSLITFILQLFK